MLFTLDNDFDGQRLSRQAKVWFCCVMAMSLIAQVAIITKIVASKMAWTFIDVLANCTHESRFWVTFAAVALTATPIAPPHFKGLYVTVKDNHCSHISILTYVR